MEITLGHTYRWHATTEITITLSSGSRTSCHLNVHSVILKWLVHFLAIKNSCVNILVDKKRY